MNVNIMPNGVTLSRADETYIQNRLYYAAAGRHKKIVNADVSLCVLPGCGPENMHRCEIELHSANGSAIYGDSSESDIYVAIDRALDRSLG